MSSTAALNAASFARDGLLKPLIFRTNCSDAARISSSVTGGSKLKSVLMFRHILLCLRGESSTVEQFCPLNPGAVCSAEGIAVVDCLVDQGPEVGIEVREEGAEALGHQDRDHV